jgi:hypothetical protein
MVALAANLPNGRKIYFDNAGRPLAGGTVTFWIPGTTVLTVTYEDDAKTIPNSNPIVLDSAGSCMAFANGEFREYVCDALGNVISDSIVVGPTQLNFSEAMRPVLEAPSIAAAEALLLGSGPSGGATTHLNILNGDQTLNIAPTANPPLTLATLNVQGSTVSLNSREFLLNAGLVSHTGHGGTGGNDKVTFYSGLSAQAGTSDVWTVNSCLTMEAGSGSYNAQGYELDFNNHNVDRGASGNLIADFTAPIAIGLSLTGDATFPGSTANSSTCAVLANSGGGTKPQWNRGFSTAGRIGICGFQEWSITPVGIQFDGAYSIAAINLTSLYNNNGASTSTAMFMKNAQSLTWQCSNPAFIISDSVDAGGNRVVGLASTPGATSGIILCANTIPQASGMQLGSSTNRWGETWLGNVRLGNTNAVTWDNNPAFNGGVPGYVYDYVDNNNNRLVGGQSAAVFMGGLTAPITPGFSLGTFANPWGPVYSSVGIASPSDIRLKTDIAELPSMAETINKINPISFTWKDKSAGTKTHYGFNADEIRQNFPENFAGYEEDEDGSKWIKKDELIAVLWKHVQELSARDEKKDELIAVLSKHMQELTTRVAALEAR